MCKLADSPALFPPLVLQELRFKRLSVPLTGVKCYPHFCFLCPSLLIEQFLTAHSHQMVWIPLNYSIISYFLMYLSISACSCCLLVSVQRQFKIYSLHAPLCQIKLFNVSEIFKEMCWESEIGARSEKENSWSSKHWKVTWSKKISHFLAGHQTQSMFGSAEKALINNFLISVVYNSIFTAALEVQKKSSDKLF